MSSLLIGCGNCRQKRVWLRHLPDWNGELTTIDMNPNCGADVVHDLEQHPLPFPDESFDELGAYDVLEHLGKQGDWRGWFNEMSEYHRILKPGGHFGIIVPIGDDALADPGHTRFFSLNYFAFLDQDFYDHALKKKAPVTDYRWYWKKSFRIVFSDQSAHHLGVIIQKVEKNSST